MDFHDPAARRACSRRWLGRPADGVLSDMAANATGHRKTDHLRIVGLAELAADFASEVLAPGGFFLAKVLQGGAEGDLLARLKREFSGRPPCQAEGEPRRQRRALCAGDGFSGAGGAVRSPVQARPSKSKPSHSPADPFAALIGGEFGAFVSPFQSIPKCARKHP